MDKSPNRVGRRLVWLPGVGRGADDRQGRWGRARFGESSSASTRPFRAAEPPRRRVRRAPAGGLAMVCGSAPIPTPPPASPRPGSPSPRLAPPPRPGPPPARPGPARSGTGAAPQLERYRVCSSVGSSISTPSAASFSRATSRSIAGLTGCTPGSSVPASRTSVLDAQRLQREGDVHHRGRMALGGGQVDDAAVGQQVEAPAVGEAVLARPGDAPRGRRRLGQLGQLGEVELDVEVAGVGQQRAVLHPLEVLAAQDPARAGDGDEQVARARRPRAPA